jgi:hypothetical protein
VGEYLRSLFNPGTKRDWIVELQLKWVELEEILKFNPFNLDL